MRSEPKLRTHLWTGAGLLCLLPGCAAQQQLAPAEIARLKGGTTTVVMYGFCVPMEQLIKTTMARYTIDFIVDGKKAGSMQSCSSATFRVKSGYWNTTFESHSNSYGITMLEQIYRPGATQYLYMYPAGYGTFQGKWVNQTEANSDIAELRKIGSVF